MMPPNNESVANISKEEGITEVTLYKWCKDARAAGTATPENGQINDNWNSQDKFLIVVVVELVFFLKDFQALPRICWDLS